MPDREPTPLELGQAAAASIGGEWEVDVVETVEEESLPVAEPVPETPQPQQGAYAPRSPKTEVPPPSIEQLLEAMLFVGGHPLTPELARAAVRGLTVDRFHDAIETLNRRYRIQRRPYAIHPRDGGFVLTIHASYRGLRERLFGGPRESRLGQNALDVLSVVAYRQPIGKAEIDAIRGLDSGSVLRHLVRLGLIAVHHRAESGREVRYGTTARFLHVFSLNSLDELPRLGETRPA
jgi:segregation and condensation protein B